MHYPGQGEPIFMKGAKIHQHRGDIITYRFDDSSSSPTINQKFSLPDSVINAMEKPLGAVRTLAWSLDGYCLAVAWRTYGFALWSVFGGLLYTTLLDHTEVTRHLCSLSFCWALKGFRLWTVAHFLNDSDLHEKRTNLVEFRDRLRQNCNQLPATRRQITNNLSRMKAELEAGSRVGDYSGGAGSGQETDDSVFLMVFNLAKSSLVLNPTADNHLHTLLCTPDSILLCVRRFLHCCRNLLKFPVPHFYVRLNFPVRFASLNTAGTRLVVSGRRGFAVCYLPTLSWRLFGNVSQEQAFEVHAGLAWWKQFVVFSAFNHGNGRCELRCYPSTEKLDDNFVSLFPLDAAIRPLTLDVVCNQLLVFSTDGHFRSFFLSIGSVRNSVVFRPGLSVNLSTFLPYPPCLTRICPLTTAPPNVLHTPSSVSRTPTSDSELSTSVLFLYAGNLLLFPTAALSSMSADKQTYFSDFLAEFSKRESTAQKYVCAFIEQFQHFLDVIIQCIRKTEVTWWRHLFCALGRRPKDLFEEALSVNQLGTAASCLVILQNSESLAVSKQCALVLLTRTIEHSQWHLVNDLIRFLRATSMPCRLQPAGFTPKDLPGSAHGDSLVDPFNEIDLLLERAKCKLLKRARWRLLEELFANLSTSQVQQSGPDGIDCFGDCTVPQWILRNREHIPDVDNWPLRFVELHEDFSWIIPVNPTLSVSRRLSSLSLHNGSLPPPSPTSSSLLRSQSVPLSSSCAPINTEAANATGSTFLPAICSCQRLYSLLSHLIWVARELPSCLAQSSVLQWCVLLSVLLLDQQMLFHALSLLTPSVHDMEELAGLLEHPTALTQLQPSEDTPLLRFLCGLETIRQWAVETAPTFASFLRDLQPEMTEFTKELIEKHRCYQLAEEPGQELKKRINEAAARDSRGVTDSLPPMRPPKHHSSSALVSVTPAAIRPPNEERADGPHLSSGFPYPPRTRSIPDVKPVMSQDIPSEEFEITEQHLVNPDLSDDLGTPGSNFNCTLS
nr:unnamed protein product [Spirometra erinaceieuropaei]